MPNFFAGISFSVLLTQIKFYKNKRLVLFISFLITGFWLTIEEYYPIFSHNIYFDYNDILMSWIGAFIGIFIIYKFGKR